eukprot:gene58134-biopygen48505
MINFGKYATGTIAVSIGAWVSSDLPSFEILYYGILGASTVYSFLWDISMDWGFVRRVAGGRWSWSPQGFPSSTAPIICTLLNLFGRLAWGWTLVIRPPGTEAAENLSILIAGIIELCRRGMWMVLRVTLEDNKKAEQRLRHCSAVLGPAPGLTLHSPRPSIQGTASHSRARRRVFPEQVQHPVDPESPGPMVTDQKPPAPTEQKSSGRVFSGDVRGVDVRGVDVSPV